MINESIHSRQTLLRNEVALEQTCKPQESARGGGLAE